MIIAAVVALVVLGCWAAGLAGIVPSLFGRPKPGARVPGEAGRAPGLVVAGIVAMVIAVTLLGAVALLGIDRGAGVDRGGGSGGADDEPPVTTTTVGGESEDARPAGPPPIPPAESVASDVLGPVVAIRANEVDPTSFPRAYAVVGGLRPDTVLQVRVSGFDEHGTARARQCVMTDVLRCGNALEVQFDHDGNAAFQYLVTTAFADGARDGDCRLGTPRCAVVVESLDGNRRAEVLTVFVDALPPPGRVQVTPRDGLGDGSVVTVAIADYPPGARAEVLLCAPPAGSGSDRCRDLDPGDSMTVGADGTARTEVAIAAGAVGDAGMFCGRGDNCGVSVVSDALAAPVPVTVVGFAAPPGADYDPARVGVGLSVAALLLLVGLALIRRTDWSPVGEEAAPEIDRADYADLDAMVAALPPEGDPR